VIAIDNSPLRLAIARHNAAIYGVADRITFILADFVQWARESLRSSPSIEVVFLSPPWGGVDYLKANAADATALDPDTSLDENNDRHNNNHNHYQLDALQPLPGTELYALARSLSQNVALYLPRNVDVNQVAALSPDETVELEEEWMGGKLKAITAYFGDLVVA
jgi:trimethylguanosine synthase